MSVKIAEFMRVLDRGGIESFVFENIRMIRDKSFVLIVTRDVIEPREEDLPANAKKEVVLIKTENRNKFINSIERFYKFYYYFKKADYDIIHFHAVSPGIPSAALIFAAKLAGKKNIVLHSHMGTITDNIKGLWRIKWSIGRYLTSSLADMLLACSDMAVEYGFSPKVIKRKEPLIIKNGIDTYRFRFNADDRVEWRMKLSLSEKYVLGSVARFADFKNHSFMLDILYEVLRIRNDACLLLVGEVVDGEESVLTDLKCKARLLGISDKVIFFGQSCYPEKMLQAMDVFLMPSVREGFGIAALEAQCSGLKVLASDSITTMLKNTDNLKFMSLSCDAKEWARYAAACNEGYNRIDYSGVIRKMGFDINDTSRELDTFYNSLLNKED